MALQKFTRETPPEDYDEIIDPTYDEGTDPDYDLSADPDYDEEAQAGYEGDYGDPDSSEASQEWYARKQK